MRNLAVLFLGVALALPIAAQQQLPDQTPRKPTDENQNLRHKEIETPQNDQGAGEDVKDAGHSAKKATKKTYHKTKKGVKKGVNKGAEKTGEAADKVQDKTENKDQ